MQSLDTLRFERGWSTSEWSPNSIIQVHGMVHAQLAARKPVRYCMATQTSACNRLMLTASSVLVFRPIHGHCYLIVRVALVADPVKLLAAHSCTFTWVYS